MTRKVDAFYAALSSIAADDNAMALMNLSSDSHVKRLETMIVKMIVNMITIIIIMISNMIGIRIFSAVIRIIICILFRLNGWEFDKYYYYGKNFY